MENVSRLRARDSVSTRKFPGDQKEGRMAKHSSNPECTGGRSDSRYIQDWRNALPSGLLSDHPETCASKQSLVLSTSTRFPYRKLCSWKAITYPPTTHTGGLPCFRNSGNMETDSPICHSRPPRRRPSQSWIARRERCGLHWSV